MAFLGNFNHFLRALVANASTFLIEMSGGGLDSV